MDETVLENLLRSPKLTAELLKDTPLEDLDEMLAVLGRYRPLEEMRAALMERIAKAPLAEFNTLKVLYFRHFNGQEH
jgi:hypothetical protein